jgi:hypothetical protein
MYVACGRSTSLPLVSITQSSPKARTAVLAAAGLARLPDSSADRSLLRACLPARDQR